jgi:hypothetical protein
MEKRLCPHCEKELEQFDKYGNEFWNCPNDCEFEIESQRYAEKFVPDDIPPVYNDIDRTNCWYCDTNFFRLEELQDIPYGHFCPTCHHSLRDNPIYGVGKPRDCALNSQFA